MGAAMPGSNAGIWPYCGHRVGQCANHRGIARAKTPSSSKHDPRQAEPGTRPGFGFTGKGVVQSPTMRNPNIRLASSTRRTLPLTLRLMVIGFLNTCVAWASLRP